VFRHRLTYFTRAFAATRLNTIMCMHIIPTLYAGADRCSHLFLVHPTAITNNHQITFKALSENDYHYYYE